MCKMKCKKEGRAKMNTQEQHYINLKKAVALLSDMGGILEKQGTMYTVKLGNFIQVCRSMQEVNAAFRTIERLKLNKQKVNSDKEFTLQEVIASVIDDFKTIILNRCNESDFNHSLANECMNLFNDLQEVTESFCTEKIN